MARMRLRGCTEEYPLCKKEKFTDRLLDTLSVYVLWSAPVVHPPLLFVHSFIYCFFFGVNICSQFSKHRHTDYILDKHGG